MLQRLTVKNYAIIDHIEIRFSGNLNTITGETGAGKSIILGALSLILGARAANKTLYNEEEKCVVEGLFNLKGYDLKDFFAQNDLDYETETIIRREITPSGKSRAFINDTPVLLDVLKELGAMLINLHSQHETLALSSTTFQLQLVDAVARNQDSLAAYRTTFDSYKKTEQQLTNLREESRSSMGDLDYLQFQYNELEKANLDIDEFNNLEEELSLLENAEEIKSGITGAVNLLSYDEGSALDRLATTLSHLRGLTQYNDQLKELAERVESSRIELQDVARELEHLADNTQYDPERVGELQQRQNTINRLLVKHQVETVADLLDMQADIEGKLQAYQGITADIEKLEAQLTTLQKELGQQGGKLYDTRQTVLPGIEKEVKELLSFVGMPNADFRIKLERLPLDKVHRNGMDKVTFLFTANKGMQPEELRKVASGGELSRLMLVLKSLIASNTALPTLIFDEIDTGISGEVAAKVGQVMEKLGAQHQVIAITHLPQIASKGSSHYFVYKQTDGDRTATQIKKLSAEDRATEIAKMLGGDTVTQAAMDNARELLLNKN